MQFRTKLGLVDIPNEEVLSAARDIAGSAIASCETAGPSGSLAVATCSLPVSSAEALMRKWRKDLDLFQKLYEACDPTDMVNRGNWLGRISALGTAHQELRREMASANVRQPEENHRLGHTEK